MMCKWCSTHNAASNVWTTWNKIPCISITEQAVKRHVDSEMHKYSSVLESNRLRADAGEGVMSGLQIHQSLDRKAFIGALRCLHWLSKEEIAHTTKYESLIELMKDMGCDYISHLNKGGNANYTSYRIVKEMLTTMGEIIKKNKVKEICSSPVFSLLCDETTDAAIMKQLIVYMRYMTDNYQVKTEFIGLVDLSDGKAETIATALKDFCQKSNIDLKKLVGLGSDGAPVMVGKRAGVAALIKDQYPQVKSIHCVAHRLALASSQACKDINYMKKFKSILSQLFYYYQNSAVRTSGLKEMQEILDEPRLKIVQAKDVRWLSHEKAITTLRRTLSSVIKSLEKESEERHDATARGLALFADTFDFVAALMMGSDVLPPLSQLSKVFQTRMVDLSIIQHAVDATLATLEKLKGGKGQYMKKLEEYIQNLSRERIQYSNEKKEKFLNSVHDKYLENAINNVRERFQDCGVLSHFAEVFDPQRLQAEDGVILDENQVDSLKVLSKEFTGLDFEALKSEWLILREVILEKQNNFQDTLQLVTRKYRDLAPGLHHLACIALVLPVSTADCERGFSTLRRIRTTSRNRLGEETLEHLMFIKLHDELLDFEKVADEWAKVKPRRIQITQL